MSWEECRQCLKHIQHDGKCNGKDGAVPCLIFERDPRGVREYVDNDLFQLDFDDEIPEIGKPDSYWNLNGASKTITFTKIRKVEWNKDAGGLHGIYIRADYWYWSDENGELPPKKPKLRLLEKRRKK